MRIHRLGGAIAVPAALVGVLASASPSQARSLGAFNGRPTAMGSRCYLESDGGPDQRVTGAVSNSCASTPSFEVPLPIDAAKSYTVTFQAAKGVACQAMIVDQNGLFVGASNIATANAQPTTVVTPTVPAGGVLYLLCFFPQSANMDWLESVNWN